MKNSLIASLVLAALGIGAGQALAAAGKFEFVTGEVKIKQKGGAEALAKRGMELNEGDTVRSGSPGYAQIRFEDGGIVALHPASELTIKKFLYGQQDKSKDAVNLRLEKGRMRAITGDVGHLHKENYRIETPVVQLGVRGTDHEAIFIPQPGAGEIARAAPGSYDKVNTGGTFIQSAAGRVDIDPGQAGFAPGAGGQPGESPQLGAVSGAALQPGVLAQIPSIYLADGAAGGKRRMIQVDADGRVPPIVLPVTAQISSVAAFNNAGTAQTGVAVPIAADPNKAVQRDVGGNAALGVDWGRWDNGVAVAGVVGKVEGVHYINTSNATTAAQLAALPGAGVVTGNYTAVGGTLPTNQLGQAGSVVSATAVANFATQQITGYTLNVLTPGVDWNVSGAGSFAQFASSNGIALTGFASGNAATGKAAGQFSGAQAQGMVSGYGLQSGTNAATGVILLTRP